MDERRGQVASIGIRKAALAFCLCGALLGGCAAAPPPPAPPPPPVQPVAAPAAVNPVRFTETGIASFYGRELNRQRTASGEAFNMNSMTAAHRTLPLNTIVRVTNLANGKSVLVRINDRGPYVKGRIIDLSAKAARDIGITDKGKMRVRLQVFDADQAANL